MNRFFLTPAETDVLIDLYNQQAKLYFAMIAAHDMAVVRSLKAQQHAIGEQISLLLATEVHHA